jgi:hypothetical protein
MMFELNNQVSQTIEDVDITGQSRCVIDVPQIGIIEKV